MDAAALRRFDFRLNIPLPTLSARQSLMMALLRDVYTNLTPEQWLGLAERTQGFSCVDLETLCRNVAMNVVREFTLVKEENAEAAQKQDSMRALCVVDFERCLETFQSAAGEHW